MTAPLPTFTNGAIDQRKTATNTIIGLKRWSCQSKELPSSRLMNQDVLGGGGWWHDERILGATGEGIEREEHRAWDGWWNEYIKKVELVKLSAEQNDALTVLLTGRGERNFSDLIQRMVASKKLEFDMICLKPEVGPKNQRFSSTLQYKQALLQDLVYTYFEADEIKVYEDRPRQIRGFREFFSNLNQITFSDTYRKPIKADIRQVADQITILDPVTETAEVQRMVNRHNAQLSHMARPLEIKRTVFYTGYIVSPSDTARLLSLVKVPPNLVESEVKYLANSILIVPRPADPNILNKVGGMGYKQTWQVTGFAFYQSNIWAVRVAPIPLTSNVHTINSTPLIVLATYKQTKPEAASRIQTWQPVPADKQYILQTVVGEKAQLRVEAESDDNDVDSMLERRNLKRRHTPLQATFTGPRIGYPNDENRRAMGGNLRYQNRGRGAGASGLGLGRGGGQNTSRGGRGGGGPVRGGGSYNRGRGWPRGGYRSLDDVGMENGRFYASQRGEPNYDDYAPGGGVYDNTFPTTKGMDLDGAAGLPYGK
ncbi:MAG: hypothetical protein Q9163_002871 [Psora crenata]